MGPFRIHSVLKLPIFRFKEQCETPLGLAVSVMAMSLDSHVVDRGSCPGPGGLKLTLGECACVPKIPRGEWRRDCGVAIPFGGDFLLSVSVSLVSTCAL